MPKPTYTHVPVFRPKIRKASLAMMLGGTMLFSTIATKADAFFGPVCVPRLENCMCTFLRPCPVFDLGTIATTGAWRGLLDDQKKLAEDMTTQFTQLNKGMACNTSGSIPGLNSIGIDINAIIRAQIPNIDLGSIQTPGLESLRRKMESLSLNSELLQNVLNAEITPDQFLQMAEDAGVNVNQLREIGVSLAALEDLAKGNADTLLSMGMDRIGADLGALGMPSNALEQLSTGKITVDRFLEVAQGANVSPQALDGLGLTPQTLHGLSSGAIPGMGIPNVDAILGSGGRVSIDAGSLQKMLEGQASPQRLLALAEGAGLSPSTLQTMGVSAQTLRAINAGTMSPQQLVEVSGVLGFRPQALDSLGIDEELLTNISTGKVGKQALSNIARGAGLSDIDLQGLGLDSAGIQSMIDAGSSGLMSTLQKAGLGNPILQNLNIDAGMLGKIASGELPAEAINDLLAGTGISPNSIIIPGADGAITALAGAGDAISGPLNAINDGLGKVNSQISEMINIPVPAIPGLGSVLGGCGAGIDTDVSVGGGLGGAGETTGANAGTDASGANGTSGATSPTPTAGGGDGTGGGGSTQTASGLAGGAGGAGAICLPNRPLITNTMPPNEFGDDVTAIDFALAGNGDIFQQQEAISDAKAEANRVYAGAAARAIVLRPLITEALDSIRGIEEQMLRIDVAGTLEDAWRMNSAIKVHVMSSMAEIASLHSFRASVEAAQRLNAQVYTALPIFPHDSQWDLEFRDTTGARTDALEEQSDRVRAATHAYNDFHYQARALNYAHEMAIKHNQIAETVPALVEITRTHEAQKENLYYMEEQMRQSLADLYVDPDAAWNILKADLQANSGDYYDPNKWEASENRATALSAAITANAPVTRYGQRILIRESSRTNSSGGAEVTPALYSGTATMPFSYPYVNERVEEGDGMDIKPPSAPPRQSGDDDAQTVIVPRLSGGIQTYMETYRRERVWTPIRRGGNGEPTMSGSMWRELLDFAPDCLSGPMPTNASNLLARPEMFDVSPSCAHITWTDGDAEDYIKSSHLGGADSILWQAKIDMNQAVLQAGATSSADLQPTLARRAQEIKAREQSDDIEGQLRGVEYTAAANHVVELRNMLDQIAADTALEQAIPIPVIKP